ncbi:fungal-specific transcription factor domain-domain-containing protein [Clohesyomyces aquaticus]|uniref:Fungal-specific transcription factor domain-domain-containing protein n=1 Tax=Clohesyomyces aquaticus TaxID=1231657 RepID=A0A1Y1ZVW6_9PLEO|nr:fungal-specific transcription factor domain-domain-containing protein [Clohesyomyces aquaticus]
MSQSNLILPTKACHNCRKRRWKCDRSLPVCQKCLSSGSECLGYGTLFVWRQGASRGKMMGKSFEGGSTNKERQEHAPSQKPTSLRHCDNARDDTETPHSAPSTVVKQETGDMTIQWALVDPLVKDLDQHARYYLLHFASQLCADMVVYDQPGENPFRDLIPATSANPLLLQVILANSAFHVYNLSREPVDQSAIQGNRKQCLAAYYRTVSRFGGPMKTSYRDALVAKQQGLSLLAQAVTSINESTFDVVLASILLFINYDLIESGIDKWRVHMEGARRLINLFGDTPFQQRGMSRLRKCLLADLLVFFVLGSTLDFQNSPKRLLPESVDVKPLLEYAETNNYLSCPAPLLYIMLRAFELPDVRTEFTAEESISNHNEIRRLLESALSFNAVHWAASFQPASPLEDLEKRVLIASAHRSAVCIYLTRILPTTHADSLLGTLTDFNVSFSDLATDIVHHISKLSPGDTVFKSITWPLFLAGAESNNPAQRALIIEKLDMLWNELYWGYILTVKELLGVIWNFKDRAAKGEDICWVNEVKRMGTELLIA